MKICISISKMSSPRICRMSRENLAPFFHDGEGYSNENTVPTFTYEAFALFFSVDIWTSTWRQFSQPIVTKIVAYKVPKFYTSTFRAFSCMRYFATFIATTYILISIEAAILTARKPFSPHLFQTPKKFLSLFSLIFSDSSFPKRFESDSNIVFLLII